MAAKKAPTGVQLSFGVAHEDKERAIEDFRLSKGRDPYVLYGADNLLPQSLLDLANLAPTHGAILKKKIDYTVGSGVRIQEPGLLWLEEAIGNGMGLQSVAEQMAVDYWAFNGFALQMLWDGEGRNVADFIPTPWQQLRYGFAPEENEDGNVDRGVWFTAFWEYESDAKFEPKYYAFYNPDVPAAEPVFAYYRRRTPGMNYYPIPGYYSALRAIRNEADAWDVQASAIKNSFLPSGTLKLPGGISEEGQEALQEEIEDTFQGRLNVGKLFVTFDEGTEANTTWEQHLLNLADKDISPLVNPAAQAIITAHQLPSPVLAGLPPGPSIGGGGPEMVVAMNQFFDGVIGPAQSLIKDWLEWGIAQMGYKATVVIEQNRPNYDLLLNGGRA